MSNHLFSSWGLTFLVECSVQWLLSVFAGTCLWGECNMDFIKIFWQLVNLHIWTFVCVLCLTTGIFGQHLEDTLKYEQEREPDRRVPEIVQMCVQFLYTNGLEIHGLFRLSKIVIQLLKHFTNCLIMGGNAIASTHLSVCLSIRFHSIFRTDWPLALIDCMWWGAITMAHKGLKLKVTGQGQGSMRWVWSRSSIEDRFVLKLFLSYRDLWGLLPFPACDVVTTMARRGLKLKVTDQGRWSPWLVWPRSLIEDSLQVVYAKLPLSIR